MNHSASSGSGPGESSSGVQLARIYGSTPIPAPASLLLTLPTSTAQDIEERAASFFHDVWISSTHLGRRADCHSFLSDMLNRTSPESCISLAFRAVSMANMATIGHAPMGSTTTAAYTSAVQAVRLALQNTDEALTDETLMAVYLLSMVDRMTKAGFDPTHVNGMLTLVKLRGGGHGLPTRLQRQIFHVVSLSIFEHALMTRQRLSQKFLDLADGMWAGEDLLYRNYRLLSPYYEGAIEVCAAIQKLLNEGPAGLDVFDTVDRLRTFADQLDLRQQHYHETETSLALRFSEYVEDPAFPTSTDLPRLTLYFDNVYAYLYWYRYLTGKLSMYGALLDGYAYAQNVSAGRSPSYGSFKTATMLAAFQSNMDDLLRTIPYGLGDINEQGQHRSYPSTPDNPFPQLDIIGAYRMVQPLYHFRRSSYITEAQGLTLSLVLNRIAHQLGFSWAASS